MLVLLSLLSLAAFANTFEWKGTYAFTLKIDARSLVYLSAKARVDSVIKDCNLPLVRAINAEMVGLIPQSDTPGGTTFMADANSYLLPASGKQADLLNEMDKKIDFYREEEKKACKK